MSLTETSATPSPAATQQTTRSLPRPSSHLRLPYLTTPTPAPRKGPSSATSSTTDSGGDARSVEVESSVPAAAGAIPLGIAGITAMGGKEEEEEERFVYEGATVEKPEMRKIGDMPAVATAVKPLTGGGKGTGPRLKRSTEFRRYGTLGASMAAPTGLNGVAMVGPDERSYLLGPQQGNMAMSVVACGVGLPMQPQQYGLRHSRSGDSLSDHGSLSRRRRREAEGARAMESKQRGMRRSVTACWVTALMLLACLGVVLTTMPLSMVEGRRWGTRVSFVSVEEVVVVTGGDSGPVYEGDGRRPPGLAAGWGRHETLDTRTEIALAFEMVLEAVNWNVVDVRVEEGAEIEVVVTTEKQGDEEWVATVERLESGGVRFGAMSASNETASLRAVGMKSSSGKRFVYYF
ncbi:hypothetical protein HK101_010948 [Irineochytrium annulatum]|nr:hypothetical protein HK101_010948 [Irineochytrium annulatum]